jgi:hypothetical protein
LCTTLQNDDIDGAYARDCFWLLILKYIGSATQKAASFELPGRDGTRFPHGPIAPGRVIVYVDGARCELGPARLRRFTAKAAADADQ